MIYKGLMLTNAILPSEKDSEQFLWALDRMSDYDIQLIEFYTPDIELSRQYGQWIRGRGYASVFHCALDQKRSGWCRLCSEDERLRRESVEFTKRSIDKAFAAGSIKAVMQSGAYPADPSNEGICLEALGRSMRELLEFAGDEMPLSIEPCDRSIDVCQLLGPTLETATFMERMSDTSLSLTMDTGHIALTFEDPFMAVRLCKPYSNHVHLANCYIDRQHPLFGDKHPLFGVEGGAISDGQAARLYRRLTELYGGEDLFISTEIIGRDDDPRMFYERMLVSLPWFFVKRD